MTLPLLSLAVDPSNLHPVESLSITGPLIVAIVVFLLLAVVLVIVAVILSRPARASRAAAQLRGAHRNASAKAQWHARIDDVLDRYANGTLTREDAFVELALIAREFATAASGKPLKSSTLADLTRIDRTLVNRQGLDTLRQTIEALYPPEFANPAFNYQAQTVTVDQAAEWVANLVERWRA